MSPQKIILTGGSEVQRETIRSMVPATFMLADLETLTNALPDMALNWAIVVMNDWENACRNLSILKNRQSDLPILMLAENPAQDDIIKAFRFGIKDMLTFPLKKAELLDRLKPEETSEGWWKNILKLPKPKPTTVLSNLQGIKAQFFGNFHLEIDGFRFNSIKGQKINAVLAFLMHHHSKNVHKEVLMEKFWGNSTPSSARNSLNVAMHTIRKQFAKVLPGKDLILFFKDGYQLNPDLGISSDVQDFSQLWKEGKNLEQNLGLNGAMSNYDQAIDLYKGDFLEEMRYEDWFSSERDSLREIYLMLMDRKSAFFLTQKDFSRTISLCKEMLNKDDCLEDIHRRLMISYLELGLRDMSIRQYHKCEEILDRELGVGPSDTTKELYSVILRGTSVSVS